jgi:non-canonical purine NTP pyrophosphatase (RdgB/HAM1 family)
LYSTSQQIANFSRPYMKNISPNTKILFATANAHKVQEVTAMLSDAPFEIHTLSDFPDIEMPPEDGKTFEENALIKARYVAQITNMLVVADDSGLEVDALQGAPGVHSKRYSEEQTDEANNKKLLRELQNISTRSARFVCSVAIVYGEKEIVYRGTCEGSIASKASGKDGFGYDPIFIPQVYPHLSMAELSMAEKNKISHRGNAFAHLVEKLQSIL